MIPSDTVQYLYSSVNIQCSYSEKNDSRTRKTRRDSERRREEKDCWWVCVVSVHVMNDDEEKDLTLRSDWQLPAHRACSDAPEQAQSGLALRVDEARACSGCKLQLQQVCSATIAQCWVCSLRASTACFGSSQLVQISASPILHGAHSQGRQRVQGNLRNKVVVRPWNLRKLTI
jgi:hypothetical protein